jgi:CRP-like cAMP-binding protein
MADLLDRVLREIRERKERSQAAAEETQRLEAALAALDRDRAEPSTAPRSRSRRRAAPRQRAPRGANRDAVVGVVSQRPGVSATEVAGATGIARATVSGTLSKLVADGVLERVELPAGGRGYRLAEGAAANDGDAEERAEAAAPAPSASAP